MVGVDQVLEKLATVVDPDLKKDIVSMGMIKDLELNSGDLKFTLELTTPACPFNEEIEEDVRKAIDEIDGIENFDMKVTAKVMEGRSLDADEAMATVKNVIGVASGKGGVGKSTVSLSENHPRMLENPSREFAFFHHNQATCLVKLELILII